MTSPSAQQIAEGQALQAAAYAQPPLKPHGFGLSVIIVVVTLLAISTIVMALRVYTRAWLSRNTKSWGWDDTFAAIGYITYACSSIFVILGAFYGLGTRDAELNQYLQVRSAEYTLYANVIYGISTPFIKASILVTLLNIAIGRVYRWILYIVQFIASVMAIVGILATLLYCHPTRAYWNPLLGTCGNFMIVVHIGYSWTAIGIVTDWTFALLPWFIIRKLQMTARRKAIVMVILSIGAVASTATIVRTAYLKFYLATSDLLYWNGHILLWSQVESGLGFVASSLPALHQMFRRFLGSTSFGSGSHGAEATHASADCTKGSRIEPQIAMVPLSSNRKRHSSGQWKRINDGNDEAGSQNSEEQLTQT